MVALYESWTLPIAVLMISPIALLGALFLQYISGLALDIYAQVGLVMLIGLSTKQAILIVEFAKDAMEGVNGLGYREAAMQAAKLRFRAVMMTNIAFILGLLPLVFAHGAGAGSRQTVDFCPSWCDHIISQRSQHSMKSVRGKFVFFQLGSSGLGLAN